jgi:hypothetical protein
MKRSLVVLLVSLGMLGAGWAVSSELMLLGGLCSVGAVVLLARAWVRQRQRRHRRSPILLLDGSNIMHWRGGAPDLAPVREVIAQVALRGYTPGVVFDANAGYKLEGRYLHHPMLARELGLPQTRVMVVNKGEVADGLILQVARDHGARVISNDRFRDWADDFPEVAKPGFVIGGRYLQGQLELDLA